MCALSRLPCSDNDEDHVSRNGRQNAFDFKDEEETVTTKSIQITQATETTTTTTRKRSGAASSKTLDLGAAAHYTGDKSSEDKVLTVLLFVFAHFIVFSCDFAPHRPQSTVRQSSSGGIADLLVIDSAASQNTTGD